MHGIRSIHKIPPNLRIPLEVRFQLVLGFSFSAGSSPAQYPDILDFQTTLSTMSSTAPL